MHRRCASTEYVQETLLQRLTAAVICPIRARVREAVLVAADEECRNGVADDAGIERGWQLGLKPPAARCVVLKAIAAIAASSQSGDDDVQVTS